MNTKEDDNMIDFDLEGELLRLRCENEILEEHKLQRKKQGLPVSEQSDITRAVSYTHLRAHET